VDGAVEDGEVDRIDGKRLHALASS
jgi:hypothetical protein